MMNVHTLIISNCHLVITLILLLDSHLLQVICNMICCLGIYIPGWINILPGCNSIGAMIFFIALIIPVLALCSIVTRFATNLIGDLLATRVA
jgi:uncharacterized protein involved in cysteine biosynthesis